MKQTLEAIKTLVPAEVYTDRQEFIDYFYDYALLNQLSTIYYQLISEESSWP